MIFQQLLNEESGCLSYLIGCGQAGEAVVVDPGRDRVDEYIRLARKKGLTISRIVETHTHADHISGNRDLAAATRAPIFLHRAAQAAFEHETLADGDMIRLGTVDLEILHTPGHTADSLCLLVTDRSRGEVPWFVLTGDTLFIGDVGRPDFGGAQAAASMWDSLRQALLPLDDSVEVYPGHGSGSLCGRAMSAKSASTIGFERRFNPALQARSREEFVERLMTGLPPKPPSFETIVAKNRGLIPLQASKPRPLSARETQDLLARGACVLDLRDPGSFGEGHVPGAVNVWIESPQFADRAGWLAPPGAELILVAQGPSDLDRALAGLARVGVDQVVGHVQHGMVGWRNDGLPVAAVPQLSVYELGEWLAEGRDVQIVDVREPSEWREGHVPDALHVPMLEALARRAELAPDRPKAVLCAGGLRSSAVISVLARAGMHGFYNVTGGMAAWQKAGLPVERS
ncbi:MAG: MBL fold metallo-hydrolase [Candidatus Rokubacteria bacterium]|nr:MBL fold metallo-hydrolase [Candidatus Rokubacteria bacterium]